MRQELIDLLQGELAEGEAQALRNRIAGDPALARELRDLESMWGVVRGAEELELPEGLRSRLIAAAERATAPGVWEQIRALPDLVRFRMQRSVAFRFAAASLVAHLILMAILFPVTIASRQEPTPRPITIGQAPLDVRPDAGMVLNLEQRRLPHGIRLRLVGVEGQERAIREGLQTVLREQRPDGSFGDPADTGFATLALLAEGDCSALETRGGRAIHAAVRHMLGRAPAGNAHGAVLAALVEDYVLSYERLGAEERHEYVRAILDLIGLVGDDEVAQEGVALARAAGFPVPPGRDLGEAGQLLENRRARFLEREPTRLRASLVLARGHDALERERVRDWVRPLFEGAVRDLAAEKGSAVAVLTLQAPYRW